MGADALDEALPARAQRFAARLRGECVPSFAELVDPPAWSHAAQDQHNDLAAVLALLNSRSVVDAELNGQRLATLAQFVGEERFDRVCEMNIQELHLPHPPESLPTPFELIEQGEVLIEEATRRPEVAHLAEMAAEIIASEQPSEASL